MRAPSTGYILVASIIASFAAPALASDTTINIQEPPSYCAKPEWPMASLRNAEEGTVMVGYRANADGTVAEARVDSSSGFPLLDLAARDGIWRCKFKPAPDAASQQTWKQVKYVWTLRPRPATSAEQWRVATQGAERGEAKGQFDLAMLYLNAEERLRKPSEAVHLLKLAAAQNHVAAQSLLGRIALSDKILPRDPVLALEMNTKAAEQGDARAQQTLGFMLGSGRLVPKDRDKAIDWLRQSLAGGQTSSVTVLGILLVERGATPEELVEGVRMLHAGDAAYDLLASFRLGHCYEYGRGAPQNFAQAAALYRKAATGRNKYALLALANLYEKGRGVAADPEQARKLREEAMALPAPPSMP